MNANEGCGKCMEKVIAIINSNANPFTAADREFLLGKEEAWLDAVPVQVAPATNGEPKEVKITREMVLNALSAEDRAALEFGREEKKLRRQNWIKGIQANTEKDTWTEADLNTCSDAFLEKLYNSVKSDEEVVDYSLNGNARRIDTNSMSEEAMYPVDIDVK